MEKFLSEELVIGKEYSFYNPNRPDSLITGIGSVLRFSESSLRGSLAVFRKIKFIYEVNTIISTDIFYIIDLEQEEYCFRLTEKQKVKDFFVDWRQQIPAEIVDCIFDYLDFSDLEKLKEEMNYILTRYNNFRNDRFS
jgi:hypothetical protein